MRKGILLPNGVRWFFPEDWGHICAYRDVIAHQQWLRPEFTAPDWTELSEEQRTNIRQANEDHWKEMRDFGEKLRGKT